MDISPHAASTALSLINSTYQAAKSAVDLAKGVKDSSLKNTMSDVLDGLLDLKVKVLDLEEENRQLKRSLAERDSIERKGEFGYWFKAGENDPLCPKCYEGSGKVVYLPKSEPWNHGIRRDCRICSKTFWEKSMDLTPKRVQRFARSSWS